MNHPAWVKGDELGIEFPTTVGGLLEGGAGFLTRALQAAGAIDAGNRVTRVANSEEFFGGGMGRKLLLRVEYARARPGLHGELFAKFPRDFGDPLRPLFAPIMEPEVRFALLSRHSGFPIAVPKCYFADYHRDSMSGLLITERIAYGQRGIEPSHEKCVDYELASPLAHYEALARALARLAGAHKAGRLGNDIDRRFPFEADTVEVGARIPYTPEQLQAKLQKLRDFASQAPQLFPPELRSAEFLDRFCADAPLVLAHELAIRSYLNHASDAIALCHWNANLDNAWFWKDERGELQAGLLDWGSAGQMNVAQALYGMTCAAEGEFLNAHRRHLLGLFAAEYRAAQGPRLDVEELLRQYRLAVAVLGIAWILDAPTISESQVPELHAVSGRRDPRLRDNFLARAQLQLLMVMLNEWRAEDIGGALRSFAAG